MSTALRTNCCIKTSNLSSAEGCFLQRIPPHSEPAAQIYFSFKCRTFEWTWLDYLQFVFVLQNRRWFGEISVIIKTCIKKKQNCTKLLLFGPNCVFTEQKMEGCSTTLIQIYFSCICTLSSAAGDNYFHYHLIHHDKAIYVLVQKYQMWNYPYYVSKPKLFIDVLLIALNLL